MEFEKWIQDKYQNELAEHFTEDKWQAFLAHRKRRRRRPFGLIFLSIGLLASVLLGGTWWIIGQDRSPWESDSWVTSSEERSMASDPEKGDPSKQSEVASIPEPTADRDMEAHNVAISIRPPEPIKSQNNNEPTTAGLNLQRNPLDDFAPPSSPTISASVHNFKISPLTVTLSDPSKQDEPAEPLTNPAVVPTKTSLVERLQKEGLKASTIDILSNRSSEWNPRQLSLVAYGGLALAFQVGTLDEQMHQLGIQLRYNLSNRWRTKLGFEFSAVDFIAKEMNPDIGIDFVESPSDLVIFSEAIVESAGINLDLGVDYLFWRSGHFSIYAGAAYRLSKEIRKGIEYEFVGDDDNDSDDDIFVSSSKSSRYFEPLNLKLTLGMTYFVNTNGFSISLARPLQLSRSKVDLLDQLQINFGLVRKF